MRASLYSIHSLGNLFEALEEKIKELEDWRVSAEVRGNNYVALLIEGELYGIYKALGELVQRTWVSSGRSVWFDPKAVSIMRDW